MPNPNDPPSYPGANEEPGLPSYQTLRNQERAAEARANAEVRAFAENLSEGARERGEERDEVEPEFLAQYYDALNSHIFPYKEQCINALNLAIKSIEMLQSQRAEHSQTQPQRSTMLTAWKNRGQQKEDVELAREKLELQKSLSQIQAAQFPEEIYATIQNLTSTRHFVVALQQNPRDPAKHSFELLNQAKEILQNSISSCLKAQQNLLQSISAREKLLEKNLTKEMRKGELNRNPSIIRQIKNAQQDCKKCRELLNENMIEPLMRMQIEITDAIDRLALETLIADFGNTTKYFKNLNSQKMDTATNGPARRNDRASTIFQAIDFYQDDDDKQIVQAATDAFETNNTMTSSLENIDTYIEELNTLDRETPEFSRQALPYDIVTSALPPQEGYTLPPSEPHPDEAPSQSEAPPHRRPSM